MKKKGRNAKDARRRVYAYLNNRAEVVWEERRREYAYKKVLAINAIFEKLYAAYAAAAEAIIFFSVKSSFLFRGKVEKKKILV